MIHSATNLPPDFAKNIRQLVSQQRKREQEIPFLLRLAGPSLKLFGSFEFLFINILIFAVWILLNTAFQSIKPFDPYPFEFLTMFVSLEAIMLSVIVLIAQNKLQSDSDERSQLDLHINLLTETETSLILKKLERIERALNIHIEPAEAKHVSDLAQQTNPENLAEFIHETFCTDDQKENTYEGKNRYRTKAPTERSHEGL